MGEITASLVFEPIPDMPSQAHVSGILKKNLQPNKTNIFSCYVQRVKRNVHMIICMSPLSSLFSPRLR